MDQFKSKKFILEKQEWYTKLKQSGFVDIETPSNQLKSHHNSKFKHIDETTLMTTQSYYDEMLNIINTYPFKNDLHKQIFTLHSQGHSKREIEKLIADNEKPLKSTRIWQIINEIIKTSRK